VGTICPEFLITAKVKSLEYSSFHPGTYLLGTGKN